MGFGNEVANILDDIRKEKENERCCVSNEIVVAGERLVQVATGLWQDVKDDIVELVKNEIPYEYPQVAVWWYSVLINVKKDPAVLQEFLLYIRRNKDAFSVHTQYFLWYQIFSLMFNYWELNIQKLKIEMWKFYIEITEEFAKEAAVPLDIIPNEERDKDFVIVIAEQFLTIKHGPTKTALDRCKALLTKCGKKVFLINTGEAIPQIGRIPFYHTVKGNYLPEKTKEKVQSWKGVTIPYYQCEYNMPNMDTINKLLRDIRLCPPEYIIMIGKGGILGGLASRMVPTLAVGLCPSDFEYTCAKYQTLSKNLEEQDLEILKSVGHTKRHVIESVFTSSLKPQAEHITKEMLGVPEDKFLMIVVGARLDFEVTDEFLSMLEQVMEPDMFVGFLGQFRNYQNYMEGYSVLKEQSGYFGFCQDILSRMEVCDLYINPIRKGGGTSCVEAMFMGVPVITVSYGDVAVNAGAEFCVKDYSEMQKKILEYYSDKRFYKEMSEVAKQRAGILLDTDSEFVKIIQELEKREQEEAE